MNRVYKKTEQIWNCSELRISDRGTKYMIGVDDLGTYNVESTKIWKIWIFKTQGGVYFQTV